jgi:hypothetical protein
MIKRTCKRSSHTWHPWFAWYPIRIDLDQAPDSDCYCWYTVWWEHIERRWHSSQLDGWWEYRFKGLE